MIRVVCGTLDVEPFKCLLYSRTRVDVTQNTSDLSESWSVKYIVNSIEIGPLNAKVYYVFYVKAWYDDERYAIFSSDGVKPDYTPPKISSSRKVGVIIGFICPYSILMCSLLVLKWTCYIMTVTKFVGMTFYR